MIEFEIKAPVPPARVEAIREAMGPPLGEEAHVDVYYRHPCRDFVRTDEAVRLSARAGRVEITYKGPRLDAATQARREVTVRVEEVETARALLEALGFAEAAVVRKRRWLHEARGFEVALDEVPGLGVFVEVERRLAEAEPREGVEREARKLLASWGLAETERRSYLELLLARQPR